MTFVLKHFEPKRITQLTALYSLNDSNSFPYSTRNDLHPSGTIFRENTPCCSTTTSLYPFIIVMPLMVIDAMISTCKDQNKTTEEVGLLNLHILQRKFLDIKYTRRP